jgi:alkylhydroperoxidase domain protein
MSTDILRPVIHTKVTAFAQKKFDWKPWLAPLEIEEITARHESAYIHKARTAWPYFRLLALDPDILEARSYSDEDIFHSTKDGLPRAERELAATTASRVNGCFFCAGIHSGFASTFSKRNEDVQRLLEEGVKADLGERWNAVVSAAAALTPAQGSFGSEHIERLREVGLDDLEILDVIHSVAFFSWANPLMLSLGEPDGDDSRKPWSGDRDDK